MKVPTPPLAGWLLAAFLAPAAVLSAAPPVDDLADKARRGREAMAAGRFDQAAALYAEVTRALPDEPGMWLNLGMALSMAGRPREALRPLESALKLRPDLLPASLFVGATYLDLGQPARAVDPLRAVVAAQPDNQEARLRLADAFWALERYEPAIREYQVLAEQAPANPRAWYGIGRGYEGLARLAFEQLQRVAPDSDFMSRLVAETMFADGRHGNAFRLYREALEKRPGLAEAHEAIAVVYERTGHEDWAATERARARAVPPLDCPRAGLECDFRAGRHASVLAAAPAVGTAEGLYWRTRSARELAREAFDRLDRLPPSPEATLRRVERLRAQRRALGEAIAVLKDAAKAWPDDLRLRRELASVLFLANDSEGARPLLEDLVAREPDSAELSLLLGETWLRLLEPAKAVPFLEASVKRDPKRLPAQAALGRAYLEAGAMAKAIGPLQAALPSDVDGSLHYQLARAYRATGEPERARQALSRFEELRKAHEVSEESLREEFKITPP